MLHLRTEIQPSTTLCLLSVNFSTCTPITRCRLSVIVPAAFPFHTHTVFSLRDGDKEKRRKLKGVMIEAYKITRIPDKASC